MNIKPQLNNMSSLATILAKSGHFHCLNPDQVANCNPKTLTTTKPLLVHCAQVAFWRRVTTSDDQYTLALTDITSPECTTEIRIFTALNYVYDRIASSGAFIHKPTDPYACIFINPRITTMAELAKTLHFVDELSNIDPDSERGRSIVMSVDNLTSIIVGDEVIHAPEPTSVFHPKRILSNRSASLLSKEFPSLVKYFPEDYREFRFKDIARPDININGQPYYWRTRGLATCMSTTMEVTLGSILGFIILTIMIHWMDK